MTSKERIKKCLYFKQPDRIGTYDVFLEETIENWRSQGLPDVEDTGEYFGHDFQTVSLDSPEPDKIDETKFVSIAVCEPFEQASREFGLEEVLKKITYEEPDITKRFKRITSDILKKISSLLDKDYKFDSVWFYGDLAYQRGLFFSLGTYRRILLPLHKELCSFFKSKGLDIILHSDGDIRELIPILIDLGINAVEPLESDSNLDGLKLRREYKKDLALFGNIGFDKLRTSKDAFKLELERKIGFFKKEGGYIYRMDKDITPDIKFDDYKFALDLVKACGDY